ncbi:MAG: hypothetical protein R6W70_05450, partial [bacterium]
SVSCSTSDDPPTKDDGIITDDDNEMPDESDSSGNHFIPECNYSVNDNKIRPTVEELSWSGYYKTFAGTRYPAVFNRCYEWEEGQEPLEISKIGIYMRQEDGSYVEDSGGFSLSENPVEDGPVYLKKDEKLVLNVNYEVNSWDSVERVLKIFSNDKCLPELNIRLKGNVKPSSRVEIKTPEDDVIDDYKMNFGDTGSEIINKLWAVNHGLSDLIIQSMAITDGAAKTLSDIGFFIDERIGPDDRIAPKDKGIAEIGCRNSAETPQLLRGKLVLQTNDVTENNINQTVEVELVCGPEMENPPIAKISCPEDPVPVNTWPVVDGSESTDYDGVTKTDLEYFWTFDKTPTGQGGVQLKPSKASTETLNNTFTEYDKATFQAILKGEYVVKLMVRNSEGKTSNFDSCKIDAERDDQLIVKMVWTNKDSDMDLHLIAPEGTYGDFQKDCYFYNCSSQYEGDSPNWGDPDETYDDPYLDNDNTSGIGPETVYINKPANGTYKVTAHAYDTDRGPSTVKIKVFTHMKEASVAEQIFTETDTCWDAFNITVSGDDDDPDKKKDIQVEALSGNPYECEPPPMGP